MRVVQQAIVLYIFTASYRYPLEWAVRVLFYVLAERNAIFLEKKKSVGPDSRKSIYTGVFMSTS